MNNSCYCTKISIIVPVYNTERFVVDCIKSVLCQTFQDWELLLIDDGSTDNSSNLCDYWSKRDNRISVIHKKNAGAGFARNAGLKIAKGDFISFVDSDDIIENTMLEEMYNTAMQENADICYCGFKYIKNSSSSVDIPPEKLIYNDDEIRTLFIPQIFGPLPNMPQGSFAGSSACTGLYRKSLIEKFSINFLSERTECISEDTYFNLRICEKASKIAILPKALYLYFKREKNSITSNYRTDRLERIKQLYDQFTSEAKKLNIENNSAIRIQTTFLNGLIGVMKTSIYAENHNGISSARLEFAKISKDPLVKNILRIYPINSLPIKKRCLWFCIKYRLTVFAYLLVKLKMKSS